MAKLFFIKNLHFHMQIIQISHVNMIRMLDSKGLIQTLNLAL
jgi:hypothetical protein